MGEGHLSLSRLKGTGIQGGDAGIQGRGGESPLLQTRALAGDLAQQTQKARYDAHYAISCAAASEAEN